MSFKKQEKLTVRHLIEHYLNAAEITRDTLCYICYPSYQAIVTQPFVHFWDWITNYYRAESYTSYTVTAFNLHLTQFRSTTGTLVSQRYLHTIARILFSIRYRIRPSATLSKLIYIVLELTVQTNYFERPVTPELQNLISNFYSPEPSPPPSTPATTSN